MKRIYTLTILLISLISFSQNPISFEVIEHNGFKETIRHFENNTHDHLIRSTQVIPTNLTNYMNNPCNATSCLLIQLGACPGDLNSEGEPLTLTDYQYYYVTENIIAGEYEQFVVRNCTFDLQNGSNFVYEGTTTEEQTDCDNITGETTQIIFTGVVPGTYYDTVAQMNETLSVSDEEYVNNIPNGTECYISNTLGQVVKLKKYDGLYDDLPRKQFFIIIFQDGHKIHEKKMILID